MGFIVVLLHFYAVARFPWKGLLSRFGATKSLTHELVNPFARVIRNRTYR